MSSLRQKLGLATFSGNIPLPLWLQGIIEAAVVALILAILAGLGPLLVFFGGGVADAAAVDLGVWWSQSWLVLHAVPINVHLGDVAQGVLGSADQPGMFHVWPLTTLALVLVLSYRAGRRLSRATELNKFWQAALGAFIGYAAAAALAWSTSTQAASSTDWYTAVLIPLGVFCVGFGAAFVQFYYGIAELWSTWCAAKAQNFTQSIRWTFQYVWAGFRASVVVLVALLGIGATVFSIQLGSNWAEVVNLNQELNMGLSGAAAMAGINFMLLINLLIWTVAWLSGASVSMGEGSSFGMFGTAVGPVPAYPLFGMLPTTHEWWMWLLMLLPVAAGFLAGWWFIREGENHVDEALDVRVNHRWMSVTVSTLSFGVMIAVFTWLVLVVVYGVSIIDLGVGRLHGLGPVPSSAALWTAGLCGAGAMLGYLIAPLLNALVVQLSSPAPVPTPQTDASTPQTDTSSASAPQIISAEREVPRPSTPDRPSGA